MSAILKVRQKDGTIIEIPALRGSDGKSAYDYAKEGGYTGTEEEFANDLAKEKSKGFLSSMDLNELFTPGIYGINGGLTYDNLPSGLTFGTLEVYAPNAENPDFAIQRLSSSMGTAYRFYANATWYDWRNEFNELNSKIGVVYQNSRVDIQVPSKTPTTLKSLTLPAGTYIVCASYCFSESFSEVCSLEVFGGQINFVPTVRGTGMYGGGLAVSFVYKSTEETTLTMSAWQGSANTVIAQSIQFDAVRIK